MKSLREILQLYRYWKEHPIAKQSLLATLWRFVCWQMGTRIVNAPIVFPWIEGSRLVIHRGMTCATMNMYCGLHEFADMGFLLHYLRPEDVFVDVGANVGTYTILAGRVVGAHVIAIEPIPETFAHLKTNVAINQIAERVQMHCCGVGDSDTVAKMDFVADRDTCNRAAPPNYAGKCASVSIISLDELLLNKQSVFWKIDVEGFEDHVIRGASHALDCEGLHIIEIEGDSPAIRSLLQEKGFALFHYDPISRKLSKNSESRSGHNFLWIRDKEHVAERIHSARKYTVNGFSF